MLYRNWNTSHRSYFSTLAIQTGECLHCVLSLTKFGLDAQWLPDSHRLIGIVLVAAQKFLGRNPNSADLKQVLGTWLTSNYLDVINECYQVWIALDSDFTKHKESRKVCTRLGWTHMHMVLKVTEIPIWPNVPSCLHSSSSPSKES